MFTHWKKVNDKEKLKVSVLFPKKCEIYGQEEIYGQQDVTYLFIYYFF